jgi:3-oxosteroid 1-dehydrogenase
VKGVVVEDAAGRRTLPAPAGVLLAAGGFARNPALRRKYQGDLDGRWSNAIPEDEGDALAAATAIGADTELTDDCWWMPTIMVAPGEPSLVLAERTMPGSLIVDQTGRRYMNEAQSYMSAGAVNRRHGGAEHAHWLVFGQRYLDRYIFRRLSDPASRQRMREQGLLHSAQTLPELAAACGLDPAVFAATVERFDAMAGAGRDEDFERGETIYDAYWGDPKGTKGTLGPIGTAPYYAARIFPGDLGTNGGLKTDEHARVLTTEGRPIEGLYSAGNGSGSPFGRTYPGAGGTIAPAATFGYIAARHAAQRSNAPPVRELAEA